MKRYVISAIAAAAMLVGTAAHAGAFILAGTDADDHGSATATANLQGWLFMQRALESLAPNITNTNKVVTILGSTNTALTAAASAFNKSSLAGGGGWTLQTIGIGDFAAYFGNTGAFASTGVSASGILMMDSDGNVNTGVNGSNFVPYATTIDSFIGAGGGLFSQSNGYQWLSALLPAITVTAAGDQGLALTGAGNTAFPGLTNADLSAGPFHNYFTNLSGLNVFANSTNGVSNGQAVIIGAVSGSIINPGQLPEPTTVALVGLALLGAAAARRKSA